MPELEIPESDIELAASYGIHFSVFKRESRSEPWQLVVEDIEKLSDAIAQMLEVEAWRVSVYTSDGFLYWASDAPDVFNSTVIERGRLITISYDNFGIIWNGFLRVKSRKKGDLLLKRIAKALDREITVKSCEQYWKDKALYQTIFSLELESNDIVQATFEALQLNGRIAEKWQIGSPRQFENGGWEFSGYAKVGKIPGLELISFYLRNKERTFVKDSGQ